MQNPGTALSMVTQTDSNRADRAAMSLHSHTHRARHHSTFSLAMSHVMADLRSTGPTELHASY